MSITYGPYSKQSSSAIAVYLDGKKTGTIKAVKGGWQYFPTGTPKRGGEIFRALEDCQASLGEESDAEQEAEERTRIGNTPSCDLCGEQHGESGCPVTVTGETIDITPESLKTHEGAAKVVAALDEWNASAHAVANALSEALKDYVYGEGFTGEDLHQLKALTGARDRKQEAFLRAVGGR